MTIQTPLILNQATGRIEELSVGDTLSGLLTEGYAGGNRLINGDFDVWQRGTSFATTAVYGPDRWFMQQGGCIGPDPCKEHLVAWRHQLSGQ